MTGCASRSRANGAGPEAENALTRAVYPGRILELVKARLEKFVPHEDPHHQPQPGGGGALEQELGDGWILNQHAAICIDDLLYLEHIAFEPP